MKFMGMDIVDTPITGKYIPVSLRSFKKGTYEVVDELKAVIPANIKDDVFVRIDGYGTLLLDAKGQTKDDPGHNDQAKPNKGWSVDFVAGGETGCTFMLNTVLNADQMKDITDENAAGPESDGNGRKIHVYYLGHCNFEGKGDMSLDKPYELPWVEDCGVENEKIENDFRAMGLLPSVNCPCNGFYLDESGDLQIAYGPVQYKLRISFDG